MHPGLRRNGKGIQDSDELARRSSVCWLIVASLVCAPFAGAGERGRYSSVEDLVNIFVSPENAHWLVGPIARIASEEEIDAFLKIDDDEAAERFIDDFWARRKAVGDEPGLTARQQFEKLAKEADQRFGEDTIPGRRTDRGTLFILYGPPDRTDDEPLKSGDSGRFRRRPVSSQYGLVESWRYDGDRVGLDGRSPKRVYRFIWRYGQIRLAPGSELPKLPS